MNNELENIKESITYLAERIEELEEEKQEEDKSEIDSDILDLRKYQAMAILKQQCDISEANLSVDNAGRLNAIKQRGIYEILQFLRDEEYINGNIDAEHRSNSVNQTEGEKV